MRSSHPVGRVFRPLRGQGACRSRRARESGPALVLARTEPVKDLLLGNCRASECRRSKSCVGALGGWCARWIETDPSDRNPRAVECAAETGVRRWKPIHRRRVGGAGNLWNVGEVLSPTCAPAARSTSPSLPQEARTAPGIEIQPQLQCRADRVRHVLRAQIGIGPASTRRANAAGLSPTLSLNGGSRRLARRSPSPPDRKYPRLPRQRRPGTAPARCRAAIRRRRASRSRGHRRRATPKSKLRFPVSSQQNVGGLDIATATPAR